jgi:hypothetical protein
LARTTRSAVTALAPVATLTAVAASTTTLGHRALGVRQQGQLAGRLDGVGHVALMLLAVAGDLAATDLAPV